MSIEQLRLELGLTQLDFAPLIGLSNKGSVSVMERGGPVSPEVALKIEALSVKDGVRRIDAGALCASIAAARVGCECVHDALAAPAPPPAPAAKAVNGDGVNPEYGVAA